MLAQRATLCSQVTRLIARHAAPAALPLHSKLLTRHTHALLQQCHRHIACPLQAAATAAPCRRRGRAMCCRAQAATGSVVPPRPKNELLVGLVEALFKFPPFFSLAAKNVSCGNGGGGLACPAQSGGNRTQTRAPPANLPAPAVSIPLPAPLQPSPVCRAHAPVTALAPPTRRQCSAALDYIPQPPAHPHTHPTTAGAGHDCEPRQADGDGLPGRD